MLILVLILSLLFLYNGYFYAQYSTNERKDGLVCMSMDGTDKMENQQGSLI